ncbi:MAG: PSK operon transcription factor [Anaerolinea sp.]|nr:PSK operon transcription factor [Anaerolinea sp.]
MRLTIRNPETDRLARELAATTGESITAAVTEAIRQRLQRVRGNVDPHADSRSNGDPDPARPVHDQTGGHR